MSRRYTPKEDKVIFDAFERDGDDLDVEAIANQIGRTPASVSNRIRILQSRIQLTNLTEEEVQRLKDNVRPYVEANKRIPWNDISDFSFYKPRRDPMVLKRKWQYLVRHGQANFSSSSSSSESESPSSESSSPSSSGLQSDSDDLGLPKPDLSGFSSEQEDSQPEQAEPEQTQSQPRTNWPHWPRINAPQSQPRPRSNLFGPRATINIWENEMDDQTMFTLNVTKSMSASGSPSFYSMKSKKVDVPQLLLIMPDKD